MPTSQENDLQIRFLLPQAGVRGVSVRLEQTWQDILAHADYPDTVRELLGQSCAAAALFTGHAKVNGRLSLQLRSQHALRTLFAECTAPDTLRGIAQMYEGAGNIPRDLRQLGEDPLLAITINNPGLDPREPPRYPVSYTHLKRWTLSCVHARRTAASWRCVRPWWWAEHSRRPPSVPTSNAWACAAQWPSRWAVSLHRRPCWPRWNWVRGRTAVVGASSLNDTRYRFKCRD